MKALSPNVPKNAKTRPQSTRKAALSQGKREVRSQRLNTEEKISPLTTMPIRQKPFNTANFLPMDPKLKSSASMIRVNTVMADSKSAALKKIQLTHTATKTIGMVMIPTNRS